ncbi:hypothetical protein SPONL_1686 [uncultured Candidatus Thioglobus sp.]|nr:hypothetical protein SPONL_1686 [uncultured Candidatus Thioglobus sp.]
MSNILESKNPMKSLLNQGEVLILARRFFGKMLNILMFQF